MEMQLATEMFKINTFEFDFKIDLEVDGLSVSLLFVLDSDEYSFELQNVHQTCMYEYNEPREGEVITPDVLADYITKTYMKLGHIYFNNKLGKFLSREDNTELFTYFVFQKYVKMGECSICMDETPTKTECRHACCYKCMERITKCPICRKEFDDYSG